MTRNEPAERFCQATRSEPATVVVPSDSPDGPYYLSSTAADRLDRRALRPLEWFNLAVIHGPFEFHLHDDFYTEQGEACQPDGDDVDGSEFPCPTLDECASNAERLLDFALTRWWLKSDVVRAMRRHETQMLSLIEARFAQTRNEFFHCRLAEAAGAVYGQRSSAWFRTVLRGSPLPDRLSLLRAGYGCLPPQEGLATAMEALSGIPRTHLTGECLLLAYFQDPAVLDWIEANIAEPYTRQWGDLAAASRIDWARIARWLDRGRPLSLVALDALIVCTGPWPGASPLMRTLNPRLQAPAAASEIESAVRAYALRDPVPRVEDAARYILSTLHVLAARADP